jgi:uncharacterized protein (TIGR03663 family)
MPRKKTGSWLNRSVADWLPKLTLENLLAFVIIALALFSRLYDVGTRVMSHDEVNHVVPSFDLYSGLGYRHDPVTHGPFQFHLVALSYFLLGDNDFSSRVPAVLFSTAAVVFVLFTFRRYLGKVGSLLAGLFFTISPYMLFYGRYTRNEAFIMLFGAVMIYSVLRYLDKGDKLSIFLLIGSLVMHFISKETAYIWTAELLVLLIILFVFEYRKIRWKYDFQSTLGVLQIILMGMMLGASVVLSVYWSRHVTANDLPATWYNQITPVLGLSITQLTIFITFVGALIVLVFLVSLLTKAIGREDSRAKRVFDMLVVSGSLILPQLAALPVKMVGWNPLDYTEVGILHTGIFLGLLIITAVVIGIIWNFSFWIQNAVLFYGIYIVFYTTFFTNGQGFFTGIVGSLGYWLAQQAVNRGGQPWYYYALIQIPMYEFLPAVGFLIALIYGVKNWLFTQLAGITPAKQVNEPANELPSQSISKLQNYSAQPLQPAGEAENRVPVLFVLVYFAFVNLIAFSYAGEKMPWLTVHIALPMILAAGWGIGFLMERIVWKELKSPRMIIGLILIPVFLASLFGVLGSLFGNLHPFQGKTVEQLTATSDFLLAMVVFLASGYGIFITLSQKSFGLIFKLVTAVFIGFLLVLTIRTSVRANYINYDTGLEYLVYAHSAEGPKDILAQVEEISQRTVGGMDIKVAYDNKALYPFWWYFRNFPNKVYFADSPTKDILNSPIIIAGEDNWSKVEGLIKNDYLTYEYMRMVWPNMDYFNLTWNRVWYVISNTEMRQAVFNIWFDRDYSLYAKLTNNTSLSVSTWSPSEKLRMYIRKDVVNEIWNYGVTPSAPPIAEVDPYATKMIDIQPDNVIGQAGIGQGQFNAPRAIAMGLDGSLYVADSRNNRIQHIATNGKVLQVWGTFGSIEDGNANPGTFNEPWGVAVGPDGSVYVADTWNYRIQKFSGSGVFITMWNTYGDPSSPTGFYGPRSIAVDSIGDVFVTDTGNKFVVIFDANGKYLGQFGGSGIEPGQFDEPVGLGFDSMGNLFVADTWNQRIQVFTPNSIGVGYSPINSWDVQAWSGQAVENKPFLALDSNNNVFSTDPSGYRVLEFTKDGAYLRGWGSYSPATDGFGLPSGIAVDSYNGVWVSDSGNNVLLHFTLPELATNLQPSMLPIYPPSNVSLIYDAETRMLYTPAGLAVYVLDPTAGEWIPVVPVEIMSQLQAGTQPMKDVTNIWTLYDANQAAIFRWDYASLKWLSVQ